METINTLELRDKNIYPADEVLSSILGNSYSAYKALLQLFDEHEMQCEWRYYKDGKAWLCKVQHKKKTVVWMSAWKGFMQAAIYFPERLIDQVIALDISETCKQIILNTKNVGKSRPCIFEIHNQEILKDLEMVMNFKLIAS